MSFSICSGCSNSLGSLRFGRNASGSRSVLIFVACFELISSLVVIYKKNSKKISICHPTGRQGKLHRFQIMQLLIMQVLPKIGNPTDLI